MYESYFEYHFHQISIHFVDILLSAALFILAIILSNFKKNKYQKLNNSSHYKYYTYNTIFKISFALIFAGVYLLIYNGGDTLNYFHGATKLNNLFWYSPTDYFDEMLMTPSLNELGLHFTPLTGYPDGGNYAEPESFFISKIFSVLMFFTGQHYLTLTVLSGWITSKITWKIYELVIHYKISSEKLAAISVLFIPSVAFWCSGISKDTIIIWTTFIILFNSFQILNKTSKNIFLSLFYILVGFYTFQHTRSFMTFTVGIPLLIAFSVRIIKKHAHNPFYANSIRLFIFIFVIGISSFTFIIQKDQILGLITKYMTEAQVTQKDFTFNKNYGNKKYDLGITDYSFVGMAKVAPYAIFTAFYRPYIWEARSIKLLVSGLETLVFIYLTFYFFLHGKVREKIRLISSNELLVFSFFFTITLAFFAGFTSVLFGVLVRFKGPFLPFLLIILTTKSPKKQKIND